MKAGRELDALIAEKVMGCKVLPSEDEPGKFWCGCPDSDHTNGNGIIPYSASIALAADVVIEIRKLLPGLRFRLIEQDDTGLYYAFFVNPETDRHFGADPVPYTEVPHAICLAALKAVGVEA